jgi:hypothetical protein
MKVYTVRWNGKPVRNFTDELLAKKFMVEFITLQQDYQKQFEYIEEVVGKSDLSEANKVIKHIMEKK